MSTTTEQTKIYPGIKEYNNCINYFRPGLHIIASKIGAGKTNLMLSMLRQICTVQKQAAAFFTNEHNLHYLEYLEYLEYRLMDFEMGKRLPQTPFSNDTVLAIQATYPKYLSSDNKPLTYFGFARDYKCLKDAIISCVTNMNAKIIFIENLEGINWYDQEEQSQAIYENISRIIYDLGSLTVELNIPIVIATHINRRANELVPPLLSDIRYTGDIAALARTVTLIQKNTDDKTAKLIVAKHTNRPVDAPQECTLKINDKTGEFY